MQQLRATMDLDSAPGCAREVLDSVPPVIWFIRREMRAFRKDLSLAQFRTLALVQRQPAASLSAVSEHLGSSLPTASRIVQGLVEQGLLKRQGCPEDRRQLSLLISERGEAVLRSAWEGTQGRLTERFDKLTSEQRRAISKAMVLLKQVFGALGLSEIVQVANHDVRPLPAAAVPPTNESLNQPPLNQPLVQSA